MVGKKISIINAIILAISFVAILFDLLEPNKYFALLTIFFSIAFMLDD